MLGRFSNGMVVKIPAAFQDSHQKAVEMDNVRVDIQFFDKSHRELLNILNETPMKQVGTGKYLYEFTIPPHAQPGNYVVHIQAKHPGSISNVTEATETFEVIENSAITSNAIKEDLPPTPSPAAEKPAEDHIPESFDIKNFKIDQPKRSNGRIEVEDVVVDVFNKPLAGVHVNVFEKNTFMPKSPNNVKISSAITDDNGVWKMTLSPGEYVFTYKGLGLKEMREFRKVI
jgi:hypothetical protein